MAPNPAGMPATPVADSKAIVAPDEAGNALEQAADSKAIGEPDGAGDPLERAADSKALRRLACWVLGAVVVTGTLAAFFIDGALKGLALYQLLVNVAMLSSIFIGVLHLTKAKEQLDEAKRQGRGIAKLTRVLARLEDTLKGLDTTGVLPLQRTLKLLFWSMAGVAFSGIALAVALFFVGWQISARETRVVPAHRMVRTSVRQCRMKSSRATRQWWEMTRSAPTRRPSNPGRDEPEASRASAPQSHRTDPPFAPQPQRRDAVLGRSIPDETAEPHAGYRARGAAADCGDGSGGLARSEW